MANPSNLYAEKIYSEHPTALWALDDRCDFASYLAKSSRQVSAWTATGTDLVEEFDASVAPFSVLKDEDTAKISGDPVNLVVNDENFVTLTSTATFSSTQDSFSIGFYFYAFTSAIKSVSVSYSGGAPVETLIESSEKWQFVTTQFVGAASAKNIVISVKYLKVADVDQAYDFLINGLSIGHLSENFSMVSTGVEVQQLPTTINLPISYGVEASSYGSDNEVGYYIASSSNKMYAKNSSVPMVFGANSSTVLSENPNGPSLIIPGLGFMNDSGRYSTTVLEAWIRVNSLATETRRIIGPISGDNGLYVDGPFLTLRLDDNIQSHYVGEWFRPMLVQIEITKNFALLFVNGEQVISMRISAQDLNLPDKFVSGKDNDYIGFYAYSDIPTVEIDCVAIYPYRISTTVAKRRFAYGQAVTPPQNLSTAYSGTQLFVDYTFANYSANHLYPDMEPWGSSIYENLSVESELLSSPDYTLPQVVLSNYDESAWSDSIKAYNFSEADTNPFISIRPNSSVDWQSVSGYVYWNKLREAGVGLPKAIYGVFKKFDDVSDLEETLIKIENEASGDFFSVTMSGTSIFYKYFIAGRYEKLITESLLSGEDMFAVGFSIPDIAVYADMNGHSELFSFLQNVDKLSMFLGGDYSGEDSEISTTFTGRIYGLALVSPTNFYGVQDHFSLTTGTIKQTSNPQTLLDYSASYLYGMKSKTFGTEKEYLIDISTKSYWKDYIPLAKLCRFAFDNDNNPVYTVDMIQFNIDYPASRIFNEFGVDTSSSLVKSYVAFDYANQTLFGYGLNRVISKVSTDLVVDAELSDWEMLMYEVLDGTIIYPPTTLSGKAMEDLVMTTIVEVENPLAVSTKVGIRHLQYASQTFNDQTSTTFDKSKARPIGTRLGQNLYPYREIAGVQVYNAKNPHSITKSSSPYLYLSSKSGIKVHGAYGDDIERGIVLPINEDAFGSYNISSINMSILLNELSVPATDMVIFEVYNNTANVRVVLEKISESITNRGRLKAQTLIGNIWTDSSDIVFYINGVEAKDPTMFVDEWLMLGLLFPNTLDFSSTSTGKLELVGSVVMNHIAHFQVDAATISQQTVTRSWNSIADSYTWNDLTTFGEDARGWWSDVLYTKSSVVPEISPADIFRIYTGTNKIISVQPDDTSGIRLQKYKYSVYKDLAWQSASLVAL